MRKKINFLFLPSCFFRVSTGKIDLQLLALSNLLAFAFHQQNNLLKINRIINDKVRSVR